LVLMVLCASSDKSKKLCIELPGKANTGLPLAILAAKLNH